MISYILIPATTQWSYLDPFMSSIDPNPDHGRLPVAGWELLRNAHSTDLVLMVRRDAAYWRWRPSLISNSEAPNLSLYFVSDEVPTEGELAKIYEDDQIVPDGRGWEVSAGAAPRGRILGWSYGEVGFALASGSEAMMTRLSTFLCRSKLRG